MMNGIVIFVSETVVPVMQSAEHEHCLFQQNGAPPHYSIGTKKILDRDFLNRWMERRDTMQ